MPEVVLGAAKAASTEMNSGATPSNMVVVGTEDNEEASLAAKETETKEAPAVPDKEGTAGTEAGAEGGKAPDGGDTFTVGGVDVSEYAREFEKNGQLSGETYTALEQKGFPRDMVDAYIRGLQSQAAEAAELAQKDVDAILEEVGGEERYEKILAWAGEVYTDAELDAYNKAVSGTDPAVARFVVQGLVSRYEREHGREPSLVRARPATQTPTVKGFENRSAMIKAMNDPRYGSDPDYTRDVERKVIASGLMRGRR